MKEVKEIEDEQTKIKYVLTIYKKENGIVERTTIARADGNPLTNEIILHCGDKGTYEVDVKKGEAHQMHVKHISRIFRNFGNSQEL